MSFILQMETLSHEKRTKMPWSPGELGTNILCPQQATLPPHLGAISPNYPLVKASI